jgi:hypothetical protein
MDEWTDVVPCDLGKMTHELRRVVLRLRPPNPRRVKNPDRAGRRPKIPKGRSKQSGWDLKSAEYRWLWKVVDGAVADALQKHPHYAPRAHRATARMSIVKRAVGAITSSGVEIILPGSSRNRDSGG